MKPYYQANGVEIYHGDAREVLRDLPSESVHCVVTSPPYWGLRDYGTASWVGGSDECPHTYQKGGINPETSSKQISNGGTVFSQYETNCKDCGAIRQDQQIGLERTPYEYISTMRMLFAEVRRVLRKDGTLWLNMGDSYSSGGHGGGGCFMEMRGENGSRAWAHRSDKKGWRNPPVGLKPKDLVGIPWMLAFALREDGWYLRQDIIWSKPNPMPESVTDRCTKAHEYIFLLSKSERYYYNQEAILEDCRPSTHARLSQDVQNQIGSTRVPGKTNGNMKAVGRQSWNGSSFDEGKTGHMKRTRGGCSSWSAERGSHKESRTERKLAEPGSGIKNNGSFDAAMAIMPEKRNRRSVWEVTTQPFPEAHFATFPEDLVKPCILAGCPEGGTVLDTFMGSGTTALVARKLHSKAIGIELNAGYIEIAARRLSQEVLQFEGNPNCTPYQTGESDGA